MFVKRDRELRNDDDLETLVTETTHDKPYKNMPMVGIHNRPLLMFLLKTHITNCKVSEIVQINAGQP
uniref:Uncharacterized protein n=1 Tax=Vespula pensylvanica TaxID=30213 RepID=A0A834UHB5_VESPE|nr:hypothetical protein H0235_001353 [Vespula pensylvanica]